MFTVTKLKVNKNKDVTACDILDYLTCFCEVARVEMTGMRWTESRRFLVRIQRKYGTLLNISEKTGSSGKD
jgi:hypothetical protein